VSFRRLKKKACISWSFLVAWDVHVCDHISFQTAYWGFRSVSILHDFKPQAECVLKNRTSAAKRRKPCLLLEAMRWFIEGIHWSAPWDGDLLILWYRIVSILSDACMNSNHKLNMFWKIERLWRSDESLPSSSKSCGGSSRAFTGRLLEIWDLLIWWYRIVSILSEARTNSNHKLIMFWKIERLWRSDASLPSSKPCGGSSKAFTGRLLEMVICWYCDIVVFPFWAMLARIQITSWMCFENFFKIPWHRRPKASTKKKCVLLIKDMSLWPPYVTDFDCPCDYSRALASDVPFVYDRNQSGVFPRPLPLVKSLANGCRGEGYQPASAFPGSVANSRSAINLGVMLDTIASARLGVALGKPCVRVARTVYSAYTMPPFCPSIEMYRI